MKHIKVEDAKRLMEKNDEQKIISNIYNLLIGTDHINTIPHYFRIQKTLKKDLIENLNLNSQSFLGLGLTKGYYDKQNNKTIVTFSNNSYFINAGIINKDNNYDDLYIKLYFTIEEDNINNFLSTIIKYCYNNNISVEAKSRGEKTNDMVVVRIKDITKLDEIISIIKKYQTTPEISNNFIPTYNGVGLTFDYGDSYNHYLAELIYKYLKSYNIENFKNEDIINLTTPEFLEFAKQQNNKFELKKDDYVNILNLINSIEKKELTKKDIISTTDYFNNEFSEEHKKSQKEISKRKTYQKELINELSKKDLSEIKDIVDKLLKESNIKILDNETNYSLRDIFYDKADDLIKETIYNRCSIQQETNLKNNNQLINEKIGNIVSNFIFTCAIKIQNDEPIDNYIKKFLEKTKKNSKTTIPLYDMIEYYISEVLKLNITSYDYILEGTKKLLEEKTEFTNYIQPFIDKLEIDDFIEDDEFYDYSYDLDTIACLYDRYNVIPNKLPYENIHDIPFEGYEFDDLKEKIQEKNLDPKINNFGLIVMKLWAIENGININTVNEFYASDVMQKTVKKIVEEREKNIKGEKNVRINR